MREAFGEFVRQKGLRLTKEREAIVEGALGITGHFGPEELLSAARARGERVSTASVYRTIPLLMECGIIKPVETSDRQSRYELAAGREHHDHMLCMGCGAVIEFYSPVLEKLQERLCDERAFTGVAHTLEIRGYCKKCRSGGRVISAHKRAKPHKQDLPEHRGRASHDAHLRGRRV